MQLARPITYFGAALVAVILPFPFWKEGFEWIAGRSSPFHATWLSLGIYLIVLACALGLAVSLLSAIPSSHRQKTLTTSCALIPALILGTKWLGFMMNDFDTGSKWFGLFHNSRGLGMEILGHIPNMVIDGCLFAVFLIAMFVTMKFNRLIDDASVGE